MPSTVNGVYRFLLTRQWVILTLVALALIPTMIKLGFWQLHRHEHKVALNTVISDSLAAKPVPVETVTTPGRQIVGGEHFCPQLNVCHCQLLSIYCHTLATYKGEHVQ